MSDIEVRGGAGSITVALDELDVVVPRLRGLAGEVAELAAELARVAAHPAFIPSALVAPVATASTEVDLLLLAGPTGALGEAAALRALADLVGSAADLYRTGDGAARTAVEGADRTVGTAVGLAVPTVIIPGLAVGVLGAAALRSPPAPLSVSSQAAYWGEVIGLTRGLAEGAGPAVDRVLFDHPWLVERGAAGAEGVVTGLGLGLPPAAIYLAWAARRAGVRYPPRTQAEAVAVVNAAGAGHVLDESGFDAETTARPVSTSDWQRPQSLADLVGERAAVSGQGDVRVTGVPLADGRYAWIVDVPGTQTFHPRPGANPYDQTSNQLLEADRRTLTMTAVTAALSDAKGRAGRGSRGLADPVMTGGHSQGGITAAALAADPVFRAQHPGLSHVVTTGSPVGGKDIPRGVDVISLEHRQDLVPHLDGRPNPDRGDWVTVTRDLADDPGLERRATAAHDSDRYVDTAHEVDARTASDPSLSTWRAGTDAFLGGPSGEIDPDRPVIVVDYDIRRVPKG